LYHKEVSLIIAKKTNTAIGSFPAYTYIYRLHQLGWFQAYENKKTRGKEHPTEMQFLEHAKTAVIMYQRLSKSRSAGKWTVFVMGHYGHSKLS